MKNGYCKSTLFKFVVLLLSAALFVVPNSFAAGRMIIKPHIETGWERDTNFYKAENDTKTVDTYYVKPGIELGYTTEKSLIYLDYWFNVLRYDDKDDIPAGQVEADRYDYTEHMANFTAETQATEKLLIGLDDFFMKTRDPAHSDTFANDVDRYKYLMNSFTPRLTYDFADKFGLGLKYTNLLLDYSDDGPGEGEDSDENRGTFTLYYYFNTKTSFDLDYQVWNHDYDKTSVDYTSNQIMLNVNYQLNYFTLAAGAGYHKRDFDQTVSGGDIEKIAWKLSLSGQNPPDAVGIPRSSMYLSFGSNLNDSGSTDVYYNATRLDARFTHLFFDKINCTLEGWYQNSDYETSTREDDRWLVSAAVDYLINDYFSLGLEGGIEDRDSNVTDQDFNNKFIMFNAEFNYNMGSK